MARDDVQVNFRMPAELKARLEASAAKNNRTLTAELVTRLEGSFSLLPKLESVVAREDALLASINEMQADLTAFMIMQGQDPAEVRKHWQEAAERIRANKKPKA